MKETLRDAVLSFAEPLFFGIDHDHELAPPRHQFAEPHREIIGQWPGRGPHGLGEMGDPRRTAQTFWQSNVS